MIRVFDLDGKQLAEVGCQVDLDSDIPHSLAASMFAEIWRAAGGASMKVDLTNDSFETERYRVYAGRAIRIKT